MDTTPTPLRDAPLLAAAEQLTLTARRLVAGALAGLHASLHPGRSHEFSQYRAYQPGDEPRQIDWKLFARSDRYFLRESDVDAHVAVALILDATGSMEHRGRSADEPRKLDGARAMAAAFALIAQNQGDPFELHTVNEGEVGSLSTAGCREPFRRVIHRLASLEPRGRWPADPSHLSRALQQARNSRGSTGPTATRQLTVLLTDGHEHDDEIRAALASLRTRRHEVLFLHFIARDEREFPYQGPVLLEEWETGRTLEIDASAVHHHRVDAEQSSRRAWSRAWGDSNFDYLPVFMDQPLERCLRTVLRRRMRH
jgi:uncharacterized protein (DUF58 family)